MTLSLQGEKAQHVSTGAAERMVPQQDTGMARLTQMLGKVFHDDVLDNMRVSAALAEPLKAGEVSMEVL